MIAVKKIPFHQSASGGCALYCFANLFNQIKFLRFNEKEVFGKKYAGMNTMEENELLVNQQEKYRVAHFIFLNQAFGGIDPDLVLTILSHDKPKGGFYAPYLLAVKRKAGLMHRVVLLAGEEGYYLVDSLEEEVFRFTQISDLLVKYYYFYQIDGLLFQFEEGKWEFGYMEKPSLLHLIP